MDPSRARFVATLLCVFAWLLYLIALATPNWGESCVDNQATGSYRCDRLGLFQWCTAFDGQETCYGFSIHSIHKPQHNKNAYYICQFFYVSAVVLGGIYVIIDVLRLVSSTVQGNVVNIVNVPTDRSLFYICNGAMWLFGIITWANWAHQEQTHEHQLVGTKIYFSFGTAFNTAVVGWIVCTVSLVFRFFIADRVIGSTGVMVEGGDAGAPGAASQSVYTGSGSYGSASAPSPYSSGGAPAAGTSYSSL